MSEREMRRKLIRAAESVADAAREVLNEPPSPPHDSAVPDPDPRLESGLTYCRDCGDPLIACECEEEPEGMPEPRVVGYVSNGFVVSGSLHKSEIRRGLDTWAQHPVILQSDHEESVRTLVQRAERAEADARHWHKEAEETVRVGAQRAEEADRANERAERAERERDSAEEVAVRSGEIQQKRIRELEDLRDRLKLEAETHAGEARVANATIHEIYQAVTEGRGEPGTWNGAKPVREELDRLRERVRELEDERKKLEADFRELRDHLWAEKARVDRLAARPQVTDEAREWAELVVQNLQSLADGEPEQPMHDRIGYALSRAKQVRDFLNAAMTPRPGGGEPEPVEGKGVVTETEERASMEVEPDVRSLKEVQEYLARYGYNIPDGTLHKALDRPTPDAPAPSEESVEGEVVVLPGTTVRHILTPYRLPADWSPGTPVTITRTNPPEAESEPKPDRPASPPKPDRRREWS